MENPTQHAITGGSLAHHKKGSLDEAQMDALSTLVHRVTRRSFASAKALALMADEIVLFHNQWGDIRGAHAFRFRNITEGGRTFRLIYVLFSAIDEDVRTQKQQVAEVGTRMMAREQAQSSGATVVWVNAPGCDTEFGFIGAPNIRRLNLPLTSQLPVNMKFFTVVRAGAPVDPSVPAPVDKAVTGLIAEQRQKDMDTRMGKPATPAPMVRRFATAAALAAGLALVVFAGRRYQDAAPASLGAGALRTKGSATLHVFRQKGQGSEELVSGSTAAAGDRIRFTVDLPSRSSVRVVGIQADGQLYSAWPLAEDAEAQVLSAGHGHPLDGAEQLDDSAGHETLYLVTCPPAMKHVSCTSRGAGAEPSCPTGCTLSPFVMEKVGTK
jgi:hypothetical protein